MIATRWAGSMACKVVCEEDGELQIRWTLHRAVVEGSGMLSSVAQLGGACELQLDASLVLAALACASDPDFAQPAAFLAAALQVRMPLPRR